MGAACLPLLLLWAALSGDHRTAQAASAAQEIAVRSSILKNYDAKQLPPGGQVVVKMYLDIVNVELYEYGDFMHIDGLLYLAWTDSRLSWTGSEVPYVDVYTDEIWKPDLGVLHKWEGDPQESSLPRTRCVLSAAGFVECMPPAMFRSQCIQDMTGWPYSVHNCSMTLASMLPSHQLLFQLEGVLFVYELASRRWDDLQISSHSEVISDKSTVLISFLLKKRSTLQTAAFVAPAFVLSLLSVSTWLLPLACSDRLLLATLSVFLHCVVMDNLTYAIPENGPLVPKVVLMYRDLLLVAAASLFAAVALRGLTTLSAGSAPAWLQGALTSAPARFLLCTTQGSQRLEEEDDVEGLVEQDEAPASAPPPSSPLAQLMNRVGLLASAGTCIAALSLRLLA